MTTYLSATLRQLVHQRASGACEYCRIHQTFSIYTHEVDHVIALKHGGESTDDNLVLACLPCNRHKGVKTAANVAKPACAGWKSGVAECAYEI